MPGAQPRGTGGAWRLRYSGTGRSACALSRACPARLGRALGAATSSCCTHAGGGTGAKLLLGFAAVSALDAPAPLDDAVFLPTLPLPLLCTACSGSQL